MGCEWSWKILGHFRDSEHQQGLSLGSRLLWWPNYLESVHLELKAVWKAWPLSGMPGSERMQHLFQNYHEDSMLNFFFFLSSYSVIYLRKGTRNDMKSLSYFDKEVASSTSQQETMKKKKRAEKVKIFTMRFFSLCSFDTEMLTSGWGIRRTRILSYIVLDFDIL